MTALEPPVIDSHTQALIKMAVGEDLGRPGHVPARHPVGASPATLPPGDKTVELAIPATLQGTATIVARRPGVISGTYLIPSILAEYDPALTTKIAAPDGSRLAAGDLVATISGLARGILSAERVLLNFLGHLSGIATATRRYVDAVAPIHPTPAICDIRKTTPAFRALDKYAVKCGGGVNHRMGLYDGVMLKDNHLAALRQRLGQGLTLADLTAAIRRELDPRILLWLEVDTLEQFYEALPQPTGSPTPRAATHGPDIILLDNFTPALMQVAVEWRNRLQSAYLHPNPPYPLLEASGGITLETVADVARTGVDRISIGALTHSAPVLDLSMEFLAQGGAA